MPVIHIDSADDPRLEAFLYLGNSAELRRRDLVVVEGRLVVERLLADSTLTARTLLVTHAAARALYETLAHAPHGLDVLVVPVAWMQTLTGFNLHRGCVALAGRPAPPSLDDLLARDVRRLLVLEGVGNPDNIGGLFRVARAFGVDGVVLGPGCGDPFYRKAIRVSCGAALLLPFSHDADWPRGLETISDRGFQLVALSPNAALPSIDEVASTRPSGKRLALLLGAEGPGLTDPALAAADVRARVPIDVSSDSLNVTVAAAIALHVLR